MERDTKAIKKITAVWRMTNARPGGKKKPREKKITPEMKKKHDKLEEDKYLLNNPVDVDPFE